MLGKGKALDEITGEIVDAAYRLHSRLGPGPMEAIYETILARDLERRGLRAARQESISFEYDGLRFNDCLRIGLLVEHKVAVEIKSVERTLPIYRKRLLTYLRLMKLPDGLLINFGRPTLR
ncbi:MAG: GxxExxY protein [Rhizomicrobium sp.]